MRLLKWITTILGALLGGGFLGGIIGYAAGSLLENLISKEYKGASKEVGDFSISLLVLFASVMKADRKIMRSELDFVKEFLLRQMDPAMAQNRLEILKELLEKDINLREACYKIRYSLPYSSRLQLIHLLLALAKADTNFSKEEINTIRNISHMIGLIEADFKTIEAMYFKNTDSSYTILQVDKSASDTEIKKAYRNLAIKYHPDKVARLGEDAQKSANIKFQEINNAYESIKKERNIA